MMWLLCCPLRCIRQLLRRITPPGVGGRIVKIRMKIVSVPTTGQVRVRFFKTRRVLNEDGTFNQLVTWTMGDHLFNGGAAAPAVQFSSGVVGVPWENGYMEWPYPYSNTDIIENHFLLSTTPDMLDFTDLDYIRVGLTTVTGTWSDFTCHIGWEAF